MAFLEGYSSAEEALKLKYRPLFVAFQDAMRSWPGGSTDAFRMLDWKPATALMQMSPDDYTHGPSLLRFLGLLEYMQPRLVAHELAALAGYATVPSRPAVYSSRNQAVFALSASLRRVLYELDGMAGKTTVLQSSEYRQHLAELIDAAHAMMRKLHG